MKYDDAAGAPVDGAGPGAASGREVGAGPPALGAPAGLSTAEVSARQAGGLANRAPEKSSRSMAQILAGNLFTPFTAVLGSLVVVVAIVGPPQDGLFGLVLAVNIAIGTVQEARAKRALDRLALLNAPVATVARDGQLVEVRTEDVVLDDMMLLRAGDQVVADCEVVGSAGMEVDESLLSGESEAVTKGPGSALFSGSAVVAGAGYARVSAVGAASYAHRLQEEARRATTPYSELQRGANAVLRLVGVAMVPVATLLVTSQVFRSHLSLPEALRGAVAGVAAMVPEGLVLLMTIAFALGALRLAGRRVLVQALPAIESLARVDVLCIDKTGTLTQPGMEVTSVRPLGGAAAATGGEDGGAPGTVEVARVLGALAASAPAPNATTRALVAAFPAPEGWELEALVSFSSARKWSGAQFRGRGSYVLGGPDVVFPTGHRALSAEPALAVTGQRTLVLARAEAALVGDDLPGDLCPLALVALAEQVRPEAAATLAYLAAQGVAVKVISGDEPGTVAAVAARAGVALSAPPCDARHLPTDPEELAALARSTNVFGRVTPAQKRSIVAALQGSGHVVAMTGDGVNDVPALKQADIGLAMGSGSQACRAVGNIVLLDSDFAVVPQVLGEGRRVIANIERVANLFITKTVYASVLAFVVGVAGMPYPFYPRQLTVVSSLTIGIPGFFLALAPGAPRAQPHFLARVASFSGPAGAIAAGSALLVYGTARWALRAPMVDVRMASITVLFVVALLVLTALSRPFSWPRAALVAGMALAGVLAMVVPVARTLFALSLPRPDLVAVVAGTAGAAALGIRATLRARQQRQVGLQPVGRAGLPAHLPGRARPRT